MESPFRNGRPTPLPASLWAATTAGCPDSPSLYGELSVDVTIIGAGFTGLAAALELTAAGATVAILEAAAVGWGASGRNNGLLTAGLKRDPDDVRDALGAERAERLLRLSGEAPSVVERLVHEHGIDCDLNQSGWIQAAHSRLALPLIESRVRQWQELGADVDLIAQNAVAERLGTTFYAGAWFDARGGSLNPLAYACGLAMAATASGARLFERSPALEIANRQGRWHVTVPDGTVSSEQLLMCVNAYNDGLQQLRGTVLPIRTAQIASVRLPGKTTASILPGGESASDTQRLLTSFRLTADNRLIMGGADATAGDENERLFTHLTRAARQRFPRLGEFQWEYRWSGYLALTSDHLPQILELDNGAYAGTGCNGRGLAMATVTGQALAALVGGQRGEECAIPIVAPRRIWKYPFRHFGVALGAQLNRILDIAERHRSGG